MWIMFLSLLTKLWSNKKLLAYLLVIAFYIGSCFASYIHGKTVEKNNYYKQTSSEQERQKQENEKDAKKAITNEADVAKDVSQLKNSKENVKQKINELSAQDPCTTSKLSNSELLYINGLIDQANKQ